MFGVLGKIGTFSNDDGDSGDNTMLKNEFIVYLRLSKLCKSVHYACRSKNLLNLNMQRQRSLLMSAFDCRRFLLSPHLNIFRTHSSFSRGLNLGERNSFCRVL